MEKEFNIKFAVIKQSYEQIGIFEKDILSDLLVAEAIRDYCEDNDIQLTQKVYKTLRIKYPLQIAPFFENGQPDFVRYAINLCFDPQYDNHSSYPEIPAYRKGLSIET